MNILWLTNSFFHAIADAIGQPRPVNEGWLSGLWGELKHAEGIHLCVLFPQGVSSELLTGEADGMDYIGYPQPQPPEQYHAGLKNTFVSILQRCRPDIVHLMGSEYPHCCSMMEACEIAGLSDRTVLSIQGLVSFIAGHYYAGLPFRVRYGMTLRDLIKRTSLKRERDAYIARGVYEKRAIAKAAYVMGRTDWDRCCATQINPSVRYLHGGEILRSCFYDRAWRYQACEKHSIFFSQATYALKGFHRMLEALALVRKAYPDCRLYVASRLPYEEAMRRPRWRNSMYVNYICDLIRRHGLESAICYCGALSGEQMAQQMLRCNVFVSASAIENSPNSVGEAMMLGMPVISSDVGGVKSMLVHGEEGRLYPFDEPYMLAYEIGRVFEQGEEAEATGARAQAHARRTHDKASICRELLQHYSAIDQAARP